MIEKYHCPSCSRLLDACGAVSVDGGEEMPVFQCDDCVKPVVLFGESIELALTFYVNAQGQPVDPAADLN